MKNFGFGVFADADSTEEDMEGNEIGIFEGDPNEERKEYTERLVEFFYGSENENNWFRLFKYFN